MLKIAIPLPRAEDIPQDLKRHRYTGLGRVDQEMTPGMATTETHAHPGMKYLGYGANGAAFAVGGNKVAKYTVNEPEYEAAKIIMNMQKKNGLKHLPGIVAVYQAEPMYPPNIRLPNKLYKIVLEQLTPLSSLESTIIEYIRGYNTRNNNNTYDREKVEQFIANAPKESTFLGEALHICPNAMQIANSYLQLIEDLASINADPFDARGPNIGKRKDGSWAILDVGGLFY